MRGIQKMVLGLITKNEKISRETLLKEMRVFTGTEDFDKLCSQLDQALYWLQRKKLARSDGHGTWYCCCDECRDMPSLCSALELRNGYYYCTVKNMWIGNPRLQCGVYVETDFTTMRKKIVPMRECFRPMEVDI